jgi:two-component system CheB/CheR fusion protein
MNEELRTVNAELRSQVECMAAANSDLQNLIQATEAAALFLDTGLRIRMFTLQVANIFSITAADEGRAITEFTQRLVDVDVEREAAKVLRNLTPVEKEVATTDGRRLMLCLRPYRTVDDGIDGVVATFVDVTERRRATARLRDTEDLVRRSWDLLARVAAGSSWGWGTWDLALGAASWDGRARELLGLGAAGEASAEAWLERMHADDRAAVERELEAAVRERRCFEVVARVPRADDGVRTLEAVGVVLGDAAGRPVRGTVLLRDATDADGAARP